MHTILTERLLLLLRAKISRIYIHAQGYYEVKVSRLVAKLALRENKDEIAFHEFSSIRKSERT